MTDYLAEAKELLDLARDPDTRTNSDEWLCQREAGVYAIVGILEELRALNSGRDQFHREVLDVLSAAKSGDQDGSPVGSRQPAAAPGCHVCGRQGVLGCCDSGQSLTYGQWVKHHDHMYRLARGAVDANASGNEAHREASVYADEQTIERFGPCPEES
jgi:hypothetical protein